MIIYKYKLLNNETTLNLPHAAKLLSAQLQDGDICLWFLLDETVLEMPEFCKDRTFTIFGTGIKFPNTKAHNYISTILSSNHAIVYHIFEVIHA
jgi:hypothetical protein